MRQEKSGFWGFFAKVFVAAVFLIAVYYVWRPAFWAESSADPQLTPTIFIPPETLSSPADNEPSPDPSENRSGVPVHADEIADTRFLELINGEYPVGGETESVGPAWPTVAVSAKTVTLHETALDALNSFFDAAVQEDFNSFYLGSGYRGAAEQREIYNNASDKSFVQKPGHSEHQTGLAADIFALGVGQYDMEGTPEALWLAENAWRYGFILRYPEEKESITKISYEPWHFRYLGRFHAWYCYTNDLCLEEYIALLKDAGEIRAELDGFMYTVLYQTPEDGILIMPENLNYSVSGDNTGGYIVTAWE